MNPDQIEALRAIGANIYTDANGVLHIDFCSQPQAEYQQDKREEREGDSFQ